MIKRIISALLMPAVLMCVGAGYAANVSLSDMSASHWAYDAVSTLVADGTVNGFPDGTFRPENTVTYGEFEKMITGVWKANPAPIDREGALDMLWKHKGSPEGFKAAGIITRQMKNSKAAAWGYATGLMQGDGLSLRPGDTLSRAEAAALIVRAKTLPASAFASLADTVPDSVTKTLWNAYGIFESDYVPDDTIGADEFIAGVIKLGKFKNAELSLDNVTVGECAHLLSYASASQSGETISANSLDGVSDKYGKVAQIYYAYALENGLELPKDENAQATKRDIALIITQLDALFGRNGVKVNKNVASYPANHEDYAYLQEDVSVGAYAVAFDNGAKPVDTFDFVSGYSFIYENFVDAMEGIYGRDKVELTFIPSMVAENPKTEAILRVKCKLVGTMTAAEIFGAGYENAGEEFYFDIHTGEPVLNIYIPTDIARTGKFVCNN